MMNCRQGVHDFLRAYYHHKSADWTDNKPHRLEAWTATELARMPTYYIMDLHENMAETVAHEMPTPAQIAACRWLHDNELRVYSGEYQRVGFQGGLQNYRTRTGGSYNGELQVFTGRTIDAVTVRPGQERLGCLPGTGQFRAHAEGNLHRHARLPSARRRRPLGAAGAGGEGQRIADRLPASGRCVGWVERSDTYHDDWLHSRRCLILTNDRTATRQEKKAPQSPAARSNRAASPGPR